MTAKKITHGSLAEALAAAQGEMSNPPKNCKNPHFGNRYADLASVLDALRPILSKHGIAYVQTVDGDGATVTVSTRLMWGSEVMDCGSLSQHFSGGKNASQAMGSAITYARRYTLSSVLGVAPDDDDDAEPLAGASPPRPAARSPQTDRRTPKEKARKLRDDQLEALRALLRSKIGCKNREDVTLVVDWASGGAYTYDSMLKDEDGPASVLGSINELNDGAVPFEHLLDWAHEKELEKARGVNQ